MGVTAGFCALKARFIPLATRRTTESVMTKFGFIRSGKGEIFWRKAQRNETIAQLSDLERQRLQEYPFLWRVSALQRMIGNILCLQVFSLNVFKFDLYLLN